MCGLIAVVNKENGKFPVDLLTSLLLEAHIRGQHATGMSYIVGNELRHHIEPRDAKSFHIPFDVYDAKAAMIHTRYSTSDLQWNQPNFNESTSIIHNGVVTQADPLEWEGIFGVRCKTKNDSEILLHLMNQGKHPLELVNTSQACIFMDSIRQELSFWRNEQRPLYYVNNDDFLVVASTKDIIYRAGILGMDVWKCLPCVDYTYDLHTETLTQHSVRIANEDLQEEF
jgi:glutamine phosphoribosylpyrophosphate amidotransferase